MPTLANASAVKALEQSSSQFSGPNIETGTYAAVVVGVQGVTTTYEQKTKEGYRLIFQYEDDDGNRFHIASKQFDLNFYSKSNFATMLTSWTGCQNTPEAIMKVLEDGGFLDEKKDMKWDNFIGKPAALMLELKPGKKDPEKTYVNLVSVHKPSKKTGRIDAKVEEIPWFLGEIYGGTVDDALYMEGFTVGKKKESEKKPEAKSESVPDKKAETAKAAEAEKDDGSVSSDDPDFPF